MTFPQFNHIPVPEIDLVTVAAGGFVMGPGAIMTTGGIQSEAAHSVTLAEYKIGRHSVTNAQYRTFVEDTGHWPPLTWEKSYPDDKADHPVSGVMWADAWLFCAWMADKTGLPYHLPTEAEWEKAATWNPATGKKQPYPWGDDATGTHSNSLKSGNKGTTRVGFYSPHGDSPYGCTDMSGNVDEWCNTVTEWYPYVASDGREELHTHGRRVIRGGDWYSIVSPATRRNAPSDAWTHLWGFRVALGNSLSEAHHDYLAKLKDSVDQQQTAWQSLIAQTPKSAQNLYNRGTWLAEFAAMGLNHDVQAEEDLTRALDLALSVKTLVDTPLAYVYFNLARLQLNMQKYDLVVANMTQAIALDPSDLTAYVFRADAYCALKKWDKAEQDLDTVRRVSPQSPIHKGGHSQSLQAQILASKGQKAQAIALYTEIIQRPMFTPLALPLVHWLRGQLYEKMGQINKALSDYYHFILWKPDAPEGPILREKLRD